MQITYLGHAGFCVETECSIIMMDPWLSKEGAFDATWFQYPKNHHMGDFVNHSLLKSPKDKYVYISHEHRDHFDLPFLKSLKGRDFTLLLANFNQAVVKLELEANDYQCKKIVLLSDNEAFKLKDAELRLFILDTELNCDSAILIKHGANQFLNLNDCKIYDRLPAIVNEHGLIDILTAQFSGASWHPTCYQMPDGQYQNICKQKKDAKFRAIAEAIKEVHARIYLPSAGPPCFLDPSLLAINFQAINAFPRAHELLHYLDKYYPELKEKSQWSEIFPGDKLEVPSLAFERQSPFADDNVYYQDDIQAYAKEYDLFFAKRAIENKKVHPRQVFKHLKIELEKKINELTLVNERVKTLLYWRLSEIPEQMLCLNLAKKTIDVVKSIGNLKNYFCITTPAWQVNKVLNGQMTWPDFALTLRVRIERVPDVYNTILHGFLILEPHKIHSFCQKMAKTLLSTQRVTIKANNQCYSILRYCPHQCGDLSQGYLEGNCWVCPIHQWRFDLTKGGLSSHHGASIESICLTKPKHK